MKEQQQAAFADMTQRIVEKFQRADARCAVLIGLESMSPAKALTALVRVRYSWEALIPGIGERLVAERTEQAALNHSKRKEIHA